MTVGELKAILADADDSKDVFIDHENLLDDEGNMAELEECAIDEEGDVILSPEG